ncbi:ROK family transcriptional regulator [Paenibacillus sp.]|uniref:ROK family transcriptional regulator n=1 Tax=Paenibacillus sp. TaxID=58172 RepID=UPI002D707040|nr:ROK family transcriptional regulator [Paenibacillus sp.]HZG85405.1 ROK family transcriptional regulator [Paenibacillus sp.]
MHKSIGVQPNDLRETNRLAVLRQLQNRVASRADLSSELGLSKPSVSSIIVELMELGLVEEIGHGESKDTGGKRPIMLSLREDAGLFISIYFNSEWHEISLMNFNQRIVAYKKQSSTVYPDFRRTFADIADDVREMIREARAAGNSQPILACGVVLKGTVHAEQGLMSYTATIPDWRDVPLVAFLEDELQVPVFIENDARANTLFELSNLHDRQEGTLVYVSVGLGIGTGVVLSGNIFRGDQGGAVNFAHTAILQGGPICSCGNRGCWEAVASTKAFLTELSNRDSRYIGASLSEALDRFASSGDDTVREVLHDYTAYWLGIGLANIMNIFNPQTIMIQSEFNRVGDWFRERIEEVGKNRALPFARNTKIVYAGQHEYLHLKSAFAVVMQHFLSKEHHKKFPIQKLFENIGANG